MKKVISYSLWGNDKKYTYNLIFNCLQAKHFFPGWLCRIYHDDTVDAPILKVLSSFDNVELVKFLDIPNSRGMYWRHFAASDPQVEILLVRDADAWICKRDRVAVDEWLASDKSFHLIRDNCHHRSPLMGGTWGVRNGLLKDMNHKILTYLDRHPEADNNDQVFLNAVIYPIILPNSFIHGVLNPPMEKESHAKPIPPFEHEELPNMSYQKAYDMNIFWCDMCSSKHDIFIGCQIKKLPPEHIEFVEQLIAKANI